MGIDKPVALLGVGAGAGAAVIGALRPAILFPAAALTGLWPIQIEAILAHEWPTYGGTNYLVNLLQSVVETLLFYHPPAVWWVRAGARGTGKLLRRTWAVEACGDRAFYANCLAGPGRAAARTPRAGDGRHGRRTAPRIRRILSLPRRENTAASATGALLLVATTALTMLLAITPVGVGPGRRASSGADGGAIRGGSASGRTGNAGDEILRSMNDAKALDHSRMQAGLPTRTAIDGHVGRRSRFRSRRDAFTLWHAADLLPRLPADAEDGPGRSLRRQFEPQQSESARRAPGHPPIRTSADLDFPAPSAAFGGVSGPVVPLAGGAPELGMTPQPVSPNGVAPRSGSRRRPAIGRLRQPQSGNFVDSQSGRFCHPQSGNYVIPQSPNFVTPLSANFVAPQSAGLPGSRAW